MLSFFFNLDFLFSCSKMQIEESRQLQLEIERSNQQQLEVHNIILMQII